MLLLTTADFWTPCESAAVLKHVRVVVQHFITWARTNGRAGLPPLCRLRLLHIGMREYWQGRVVRAQSEMKSNGQRIAMVWVMGMSPLLA